MNNLLVIEWISFNSIELYNGFFVAALSHLNFDLYSVLILFSFNLVTVSINDADLNSIEGTLSLPLSTI